MSAWSKVCPNCGATVADERADIVDKYIAALHHPQAETRLRAAWLLGKLRTARAIPALLTIIVARGSGDPYLLCAATWSLGAIGDPQIVPTLTELLADKQASFMARVEAGRALGQFHDDATLAALRQVVDDPNRRVREAAITVVRQAMANDAIDQPEV
jgi:HEAT repeat protein